MAVVGIVVGVVTVSVVIVVIVISFFRFCDPNIILK